MLILTRKTDEEIVINSDIRIKIISTSDNQIKIGITAPNDVKILRGEIYEKIKQSSIEAVNNNKGIRVDLSNIKVNKIQK